MNVLSRSGYHGVRSSVVCGSYLFGTGARPVECVKSVRTEYVRPSCAAGREARKDSAARLKLLTGTGKRAMLCALETNDDVVMR